MSRTALVLGVNGQDGSFIAEQLLMQGDVVVGIGRQASSRWVRDWADFTYLSADLLDTSALIQILDSVQPTTIFHAAAVHGPAGFEYESDIRALYTVNTLLVGEILEWIRVNGGKLIYFSSSKVFKKELSVISEKSERASACLYSASKNSANDLIIYYRRKYGVWASVLWTFNHDSYRRPEAFFMSKVANTVYESVRDENYKEEFHSLDFFCDWGSASEYAEVAVKSSLLQTPEDFVVASGEYVHALDLIFSAFDAFGLNYENHIITHTTGDGEGLDVPKIDNSKLVSLIPNVIQASAHQVLEEMISRKHAS